jgi:hypothetical protein
MINIENLRKLRETNSDNKFKLIEKNIERFFRDLIYYFNIYEREELIIESGYLPYHYLDNEVIHKVIDLLENKLGYNIIIVKINNINKQGYYYGDLLNIRLFDPKYDNIKQIDTFFNMKMYQPLYSTYHNFNNLDGNNCLEVSYLSCGNTLKLQSE